MFNIYILYNFVYIITNINIYSIIKKMLNLKLISYDLKVERVVVMGEREKEKRKKSQHSKESIVCVK